MHQDPIIWTMKRPHIIKHKSLDYVVSFFYISKEHNSLYAVARATGSGFRMIEVREGDAKIMNDYVFDDVYIYDRGRYYSRDGFNIGFSTELDGEHGIIQFCFVNKDVNGLLTCYPVCFNSANIESGIMPFVICPSFVCESFSREYYYLNGRVYRHDMKTGYTGKGWYKEIHRELQFHGPKPSSRSISCYQYEHRLNSSMGVWRVVDEDGTDEKISIDQIEASNILFADFRDKNAILVGVELEERDCPKELLVYEYKDGPILRERIECNRWDIYEMQEDTLIVLLIWQSIELYSKKKGFLSRWIYDDYPFFGEDLEGREFILTPAGLSKGERGDILRISPQGELTLEQSNGQPITREMPTGEPCGQFIINWNLIECLDLDFSQVDIEALQVDKHEDTKGHNWEYTLITTMYSSTDPEKGRDAYTVRWHFKDIWGNAAHIFTPNLGSSGTLVLKPIYYHVEDRFEARIIFSIYPNYRSHYIEMDGTTTYGHGDPVFTFEEPDETSIQSVELKEHQSIDQIPPKREDESMLF